MNEEIELTPGGRLPFEERLKNDLRDIYKNFELKRIDKNTAARMKTAYEQYIRHNIASGKFRNIPFDIEIQPDTAQFMMLVRFRDGNGRYFRDLSLFDPDPNEMRV
jgi:CRISPR/Cas system endoribonuclease Cas6 (RAMP superfamily)